MNEIRGMYLCNSLSQAKMRKQEKHRGKQRTQHSKNTVLVNCDAALNRPSEQINPSPNNPSGLVARMVPYLAHIFPEYTCMGPGAGHTHTHSMGPNTTPRTMTHYDPL